MPNTISLACYSVRVRESGSHATLDFSDAKAAPLLGFFDTYFKARAKANNNNTAAKKVLGVRLATASGQEISGILTTGEYGYETDLLDVKGKKPVYRRSTDQAEMLPFYFHLYIPKTGKCGILILQRFGLFGVRTILTSDLDVHFSSTFPDLTLNIWPQVPDGVLQALLGKGGLKKIILRRETLPADVCDSIDEDFDAEAGKMELVITGREGVTFDTIMKKIRDQINGRVAIPLSEVITVNGFQHDKILIEVEIGERKQIVDLSNLGKLRAHIDVTKNVKLGADGHPTLPSISAEGQQLLAGLRKTLGV